MWKVVPFILVCLLCSCSHKPVTELEVPPTAGMDEYKLLEKACDHYKLSDEECYSIWGTR